MNGNLPLQDRVRRLRRRLLGIGLTAGMVWGLAAAVALCLLGAWLDLLWEFSPLWRIATLWAAAIGGGLLLIVSAALALRAAGEYLAARRLDRAGDSDGRIFTGWELEQSRYGIAGADAPPLSAGLAALEAADAAVAAGKIPLRKAAPLRPLGRSAAVFCLLGAIVGALALGLPGMASTQWNRFLHPYADVPPFSLTEFDVTPGDAKVVYGEGLDISTAVRGAPVEQVELVLTTSRGPEPPLPMFPEADGRWRAALTNITQPTDYFVRAYRARSKVYHIGVITVPLITGVRLRIEQPEYTHRPAYVGPLPKDGVSGLRGTKVQVFLASNRRLKGGRIELTEKTKTRVIAMQPTGSESREAVGEFRIQDDGKFECRVIDEAGQESQQTAAGNVILLLDTRPFIRVTQPPRISLATPSAGLPVMLSAEDDCGIAQVQLYRSLNDSRPLPTDVPLPKGQPRRCDLPAVLPLDQYGLVPGDVIKLFGRVEDNDPAGAKGAESAVAVVRIISEEEYQRLIKEAEGIEAMMSKYDAARRRMERLAEELDKLQKELDKLPPDEKMSAETGKRLERLQEMFHREAEAMRKSAQLELPYDLDKQLAPELQRMARMTEEMAKTLEKLAKEREEINKKLRGKLDELAKRLAKERGEYRKNVSAPLEYLEAVLPLLADQSRFTMIVLWQRDLAERMATLKGKDNPDDPALKARMRDLEQEQRQIGDALARLLDDVEEHAAALPEKPELEKLRETALDFAKRVRASGAAEAIGDAAAALAEFHGTRAHEKAKEAADILEKFLNECKNCGNSACNGTRLVFRPSLCNSMGNTIQQLLSAGFGSGSGSGNGFGAGGFGSIGLFGGLPEMYGLEKMGQGRDSKLMFSRQGHASAPSGANPDATPDDKAAAPPRSGGLGDGSVPLRYRRKVGEYFQRVEEETGETPR